MTMKHLCAMTLLLVSLDVGSALAQDQIDARLRPYVDALREEGEEPIAFLTRQLDSHDLLIFDDAVHFALEPFEFYQQLIRTPSFRSKIRFVFIEVFHINTQPDLDAYLDSEPEDRTLLYPAFQDDSSGTGWRYMTYFDLLRTIRSVNRKLPDDQRIRVLAVNVPTYWSEIRTSRDVELFRKAHIASDYTMYRIILEALDDFRSGHKGILLTNTRHAYKGIKDRNGQYFWNCATFFHQWHPGKTSSIRFHNVTLSVEGKKKDSPAVKSTEGMEEFVYRWVRLADGLWDSAFQALGNKPIALPLRGNAFGRDAYVGNHSSRAAPGQTMFDANDAVIFLAPLEELHRSATVDFIYTEEFKKELARRFNILYPEEQLKEWYNSEGVDDLRSLIEKRFTAEPQGLSPLVRTLDPIDAWKEKK